MDFDGIIFDMDGTLLDSMKMWGNICYEYLKYYKIEYDSVDVETLKRLTLQQSTEFLIDKYKLDSDVESDIAMITSWVINHYKNDILPKDHVIELLNRYKAEGKKMCVATASNLDLAKFAFSRLNMLDYFDFILACPDFNCNKHTSFIYDKCVEKLGMPKEKVVVFEDALHCIQAVKDADFKVIGVFDESETNNQSIIKDIVDKYIINFGEML